MKIWDVFLNNLEEEIGKQSVQTWLRPLKVVDFDACNLYLEAENSFQIHWFEEHIRKLAKNHFTNENGHLIKIQFINQKKQKKKQSGKEGYRSTSSRISF